MAKRFDKDRWVKVALARGYLIANIDGTIYRARKADANGIVDRSKGYALVTPQIHKKSGRVYFNMTYMGFTKSVLVNRVIALRYLPNPDNLPQVNHVDGDKEHNWLYQPTPELREKWGEYQLEWSSGSDNEKHAHRTGLKTGRGSANSNAKLTVDDVLEIRKSDEPDDVIAKRKNVSRSTVINVRAKRTWSHV